MLYGLLVVVLICVHLSVPAKAFLSPLSPSSRAHVAARGPRGLAPSTRTCPRMTLDALGGSLVATESPLSTWAGTILAEGNIAGANNIIFQNVFVGGMVIIGSGIVAAYIVGTLLEYADIEEIADNLGGLVEKESDLADQMERRKVKEKKKAEEVAAASKGTFESVDLSEIVDEYSGS